MGRGPSPLRANRDRTPPNAPRDSWRCESISSEHRRCLANEPTLVGIEHGIRDARKRSTEDTWLQLGVVIGTIQGHECRNDDLRLVFEEVPDPRAGIDAGGAHGAWRHGRRASTEPFHRALLGADGPFDLDHILAVTRSVCLDAERLARDMEDPALDPLIERNASLANALGVRGTPAFVIGDGMIRGAPPVEQFRAAIVNVHGSRRKARGIRSGAD